MAAMEQLEKQRLEATAERQQIRAECQQTCAEMRAECQETCAKMLADAKAEISRLKDESAEIRKDMDKAKWGNSWHGWWNKDYTGGWKAD